jgi:uncharacterized protein
LETNSDANSDISDIDERHPKIKPRRVSFDWEKTPLHWIPRDPVATHMVNAFNVLLPAGERWFIQVVKDAQPSITDARLLTEIKGFIGQEMVHARSHEGVLEQLLEKHGIDVKKITDLMDKGNAERPARRAKMSPRKARWMLRLELAAVSAIEHYTAVFGQWIVDARELDEMGADATMLDLLRWHGAEEVEHRSVVFDTFKEVGGSYPERVLGFSVAMCFLYLAMISGTLDLLRQDSTVTRKVTLPAVLRSYRRSVRKGHVPPIFSMLLSEAPIYLRPSHHPSQVCSTERALDYLLRSPAARAAGYTPY